MSVSLTYHGHAALAINIDGTNVLVDPFITDNPLASIDSSSIEADYILVSHRRYIVYSKKNRGYYYC